MKRLTQIFQALIGVVALILTTLVAIGRLAWRTLRKWWRGGKRWLCWTIAVVVVGFVGLYAYSYYRYCKDYQHWGTRHLSERVEVHRFRDDKCRIYNTHTKRYTTAKIDWVSEAAEGDSIAVYAQDGKRGYVNVNTGQIVVDARKNDYRKAWVFSEGVGAVVKGDKVGFVNAQNEVVIPFVFDYSDECPMWDFGYLFHSGYCIMTNAEGLLGMIDSKGNWVVEPVYDEIWAPHTSGYRVVLKGDEYGVLRLDGSVLYPAEYRYVEVLADGFVLAKEGAQWQVDSEGRVVYPFVYDWCSPLSYCVGYDECGDIIRAMSDYSTYSIKGLYGVLNHITGEVITKANYSNVDMLSKGLFEVELTESGDKVLLDRCGNLVSPK